jgi:CHASE3 domain sensor protein
MLGKRFSFELKILGIMLIILGLVSIMGIYTYQRFSGIVKTISEETRPDMRLLTAKSLMNDISIAENSVKTFSLTKDTLYLNKFYASANNADTKMIALHEQNKRTGKASIDLDTLDELINGKFTILRNLLVMQDEFRVQQALDKVVFQLKKSTINPATIKEVEYEGEEQESEANIEKEDKPKRRGFLSRLFGRTAEEEIKDEPEPVEKILEPARQPLPSINNQLTLREIHKGVQVVKREEKNIESAIKAQELELIMADKVISDRIRALLARFETAEMIYIAEKT